jgi:PAS domain S-box-containing protein
MTKSKQSSDTVENLLRQNELVLNAAGEGIYGLNCKGITTFVNPAASRMLGWDTDELIGQLMHAQLHHSHPDGTTYPNTECPIYAAFKDGKVHRVDNEVFWRKDGTSFPVEYTSTPIHNEQGQLEGAVVVFWDISERKEAEARLEFAMNEIASLKDKLEIENQYLQEEIKTEQNFEEIIGKSSAIKKVLSNVEQVADTNATVLILGETGTGKELFARAIHNNSSRRDRVLVKVNCATLPSNLIESELFGHKKGSFTGAVEDKMGRFELADKGTIFLDEIGELPIELQAKLLRVLQEGEFERLGDSRTVKVDIRVIAATNRNLKKAIEEGRFREDLYYRLNVFPLYVPALRQRKLDIPLLVNFFSLKFAKSQGKTIKNISENMMKKLQSYSWPGNIRELENIIERAIILSKDGNLKMDDSLDLSEPLNQKESHHSTLEDVERSHIISVLDETDWIISGEKGAAGLLGLNPNTLRSRIQKLGINRKN